MDIRSQEGSTLQWQAFTIRCHQEKVEEEGEEEEKEKKGEEDSDLSVAREEAIKIKEIVEIVEIVEIEEVEDLSMNILTLIVKKISTIHRWSSRTSIKEIDCQTYAKAFLIRNIRWFKDHLEELTLMREPQCTMIDNTGERTIK